MAKSKPMSLVSKSVHRSPTLDSGVSRSLVNANSKFRSFWHQGNRQRNVNENAASNSYVWHQNSLCQQQRRQQLISDLIVNKICVLPGTQTREAQNIVRYFAKFDPESQKWNLWGLNDQVATSKGTRLFRFRVLSWKKSTKIPLLCKSGKNQLDGFLATKEQQ